MNKVIDGRKIADEILEELKIKVQVAVNEGKNPLRLAAVLVGNNPEFEKFVQLKGKNAVKIGIEYPIYQFSDKITQEELTKRVREISGIADGILIELPLPAHLYAQGILNEIPLEKDVDVLSDSAQKFFYDDNSKILPPAVEALKIVFEKYGVEIKNKKTTVFGWGVLIGKPIAHWLKKQGAEVSIVRSKTENPEKLSSEADIIISGVGKPNLITENMVRDGAVVIDFGYGKLGDKMVGDVQYEFVKEKASLISPVPGGMGPLLTVVVLRNLIALNNY